MLIEERTKRRISIEEVSEATKIRASFISAIEKGEYNKLPSSSYAQGFVRNYTRFLGLPEEEIMAVFRREFDSKKASRVLPKGLSGEDEFRVKRFKPRQTFIVVGAFFAILLLYMLFQYRYVIINPPLNIVYPQDGVTLASERIVVSGSTNPDSTIYVNDQPVAADEEGNFKKEIDVFLGDNKIVVKSVNRFGRETVEERNLKIESP